MATEEFRQEIVEVFDLFDVHGCGVIDGRDLKYAMRALGFRPTRLEIREILSDYQGDAPGVIGFNDFYDAMMLKIRYQIREEAKRRKSMLGWMGDQSPLENSIVLKTC